MYYANPMIYRNCKAESRDAEVSVKCACDCLTSLTSQMMGDQAGIAHFLMLYYNKRTADFIALTMVKRTYCILTESLFNSTAQGFFSASEMTN